MMARSSANFQTLTQQRTTLLSIAVAAVLVASKLGVGLATGSLALISAGIESSGDVVAAALTGGFDSAFWICGVIGLAAVPVTFLLIRRGELAQAVASTTARKPRPVTSGAG